MSFDIVVKKKGPVYEATAFDESGTLVYSLLALSAPSARQLLKEKMGMCNGKKTS